MKGNSQGLLTITLELFFPTHGEFWRSQDALWQSPTTCLCPTTPCSSSCIQPKPSLAWSYYWFLQHTKLECLWPWPSLSWKAFPCTSGWLLPSFRSPFKCLTWKGPASFTLSKIAHSLSLSLSSVFFTTYAYLIFTFIIISSFVYFSLSSMESELQKARQFVVFFTLSSLCKEVSTI